MIDGKLLSKLTPDNYYNDNNIDTNNYYVSAEHSAPEGNERSARARSVFSLRSTKGSETSGALIAHFSFASIEILR